VKHGVNGVHSPRPKLLLWRGVDAISWFATAGGAVWANCRIVRLWHDSIDTAVDVHS
jgi:hypothetical protein